MRTCNSVRATLLCLATLALAGPAQADCMMRHPADGLTDSRTVALFRGRVLTVTPLANEPTGQVMTIEVDTVWKGSVAATVTIHNLPENWPTRPATRVPLDDSFDAPFRRVDPPPAQPANTGRTPIPFTELRELPTTRSQAWIYPLFSGYSPKAPGQLLVLGVHDMVPRDRARLGIDDDRPRLATKHCSDVTLDERNFFLVDVLGPGRPPAP